MISGKEILLTVIIPTNNLNFHLPKLKKTIVDASLNRINVILVIDQEITEEIKLQIESLKGLNLTQLQILFCDSRTPGGARNLGLENVITPWVAFWDSDDEPQVERFCEMVICAAVNPDTNAAVGNFIEINIEKFNSRIIPIQPKSFDYLLAYRPGLWRFAFRTSYVGTRRFSKSKLGEDQLFLADLGVIAESTYFTESIVYKYFTGTPGSLTTNQVAYSDLTHILREFRNLNHEKRMHKYALFMVARIFLTIKKTNIKNLHYLEFKSVLFYDLNEGFFYARAIVNLVINLLRHPFSPKPSVVSIHLAGGLGNQLFQLAAGLKIAGSRSVLIEPSLAFPRRNVRGKVEISDFVLPGRVLIDVDRKYSFLTHKFTNFVLKLSGNGAKARFISQIPVVNFFGRPILHRYLNRKVNIVVSEGLGYSEVLEKSLKNPYLIGLFQSHRWLEDEDIKSSMKSLRLVEESQEFRKLRDLAKKEKPLVVHVRLGDYKLESEFGILNVDYYREAILKVVGTNEKIWVFTNEEELARQIFPLEYSHMVRWVTDSSLSSSQTLELMRYGSSFVIGNSTFSWWAAFLNHSGSNLVVAPSPWFRLTESPLELIPKDWISVPAKYLNPTELL